MGVLTSLGHFRGGGGGNRWGGGAIARVPEVVISDDGEDHPARVARTDLHRAKKSPLVLHKETRFVPGKLATLLVGWVQYLYALYK